MPRLEAGEGELLIDLRAERDLARVETALHEALSEAAGRDVLLDFADGHRVSLQSGQRWRFWRRPPKSLG